MLKQTTSILLWVCIAKLNAAPPGLDPAPPRFHAPPTENSIPHARQHPRCRQVRPAGPLSPDATRSDWPCFLGPGQNGISPETGLLKQFDRPTPERPVPHLVWALEKGESYAAPSIKGRRLVYFHRMEDREIVECLDAETGGLFWRQAYPTDYVDRYGYLNGPRATPAIHEDFVYTLGVQGVLSCFNLRNGHLYWQRKLGEEFDLDQGFFGFATSPLIEGDMLILNLGQDKSVAGFDRKTGVLQWLSNDPWGRSYATPVAATLHGQRVVLVFAGGNTNPPVGGLQCLDPRSGHIHFRFPWRSRRYYSANASSPVVAGNRIYISSSYDIFGALLEVTPELDYRVVYQSRAFGSHWMTPILHEGNLYGFANSRLTCMEWSTGKRLWQQTLKRESPAISDTGQSLGTGRGADQYREPPGSQGFGIASLIRVDNRFLCLGETGLLAWLDLSPEGCRMASALRLFTADQTWTAPVISHGLLYVTQNRPDKQMPPRLLCYDLRQTASRSLSEYSIWLRAALFPPDCIRLYRR